MSFAAPKRRPRTSTGARTDLPDSLKQQDMERWVLENVEYLAKEYAIYFRRASCQKQKAKPISPTKKYS